MDMLKNMIVLDSLDQRSDNLEKWLSANEIKPSGKVRLLGLINGGIRL